MQQFLLKTILQLLSLSSNSLPVFDSEGSLLRQQQPKTSPYPQPGESTILSYFL
jgi:hypothetical protein